MGLPVYELKISENLNDEAEVSYVALVDLPAIKKDFLAFKSELESYVDTCPVATQDIKTNLINRAEAIKVAHYGPANPAQPNDEYWTAKASIFGGTVDEAKTMTCSNCSAFNRTQAVLDCIAQGLGTGTTASPYDTINAGEIGYCEVFDFKCASSRTCDAWIAHSKVNTQMNSKVNNQLTFQVVSEEEHIISGPLMLAEELIYRNSEKFGEHYVKFSADTIKQIAIKFSKKKFQNHVNLMHDQNQKVEGVTMFESFLVDKKRGIKPMQGFEDVTDGSWFGSFYVENKNVWDSIKSGEYKGFSVEGLFDYEEPISEEEQAIKKIMSLINDIK